MKTITKSTLSLGFALALCAAACGGDEGSDDPVVDEIPHFTVTGTVLDFATDDVLAAQATITTDGLIPPPRIEVDGAEFTITDVPLFSVFNVLAGSPPDYRNTYNPAVAVDEADVDGVVVSVVSEQYLTQLASDFGVTPAGGTSVLIGRLVDEEGNPQADIPGDAFALDPAIQGPFFLDGDRAADPGLSSSSASGYFVLFDVPPGLTRVTATSESGYGMSMADSPVAATAVTMADVIVGDPDSVPGGGEPPVNVSFSRDVAPIFIRRGCQVCHDGGGVGKDLGKLHLNGAPEKMYRELTEEISERHGTTRVSLASPADSLVLTMPSREDPPDVHWNVTFASPDDPDYRTILVWITEGARNN